MPSSSDSPVGSADDLRLPVYHPDIPRSPDFLLLVNGRDVPVTRLDGQADFAIFEGTGPFQVEVSLFVRQPAAGAVLRPLSAGVRVETDGWRARFTLPGPMPVAYLEIPGQRPLCLFAHAPETDRPDPRDPRVRWFPAGGIHEAGEIRLEDGQTLYIESGAVVRGWVRASGASGVRVCGRGVLDGHARPLVEEGLHQMLMVFDHCRELRVEDITVVRPRFWTCALGACQQAVVRGLRALTELLSTDGIDIVGSSDVLVEGCFLSIHDDCVSIKAARAAYTPADGFRPWRRDVERVVVRGCVLHNRGAGSAMEIGHETACRRMGDILFEDCDVLEKRGHGAVFGVHGCDEATIEDVTWRRIRVEHHFDRLFDIRVVSSVFSDGAGAGRGRIRRLCFEGCDIAQNAFNHGYTVSLVGGYSPQAPLEDLVFRDCVLGGRVVRHLDDLQLHLRHTTGVRVEAAGAP